MGDPGATRVITFLAGKVEGESDMLTVGQVRRPDGGAQGGRNKERKAMSSNSMRHTHRLEGERHCQSPRVLTHETHQEISLFPGALPQPCPWDSPRYNFTARVCKEERVILNCQNPFMKQGDKIKMQKRK